MTDETSATPGPFDVATVQALIGMMSSHDLHEIDLRSGDQRICLRRGGPIVTGAVAAPAFNPLPLAAAPAAPAKAEPAPAAAGKKLHEIKSPTPGTFYAATSPNAEPYVRKGTRVNPDTIVCQIEAMKTFTEIPAEVSGVIEEILVQNQEGVEWGTVLFRVDPSA